MHRHLFQGLLAYRMSEGKGDLVLDADARISELTGQIFSQTYTKNVVLSDTKILESKFTAQAAALVHAQGAKKEFAIRRKLEHASFLNGNSAADREAVVAALIEECVPENEAELVGTPALQARADALAERAKALMDSVGSVGVPTISKVQNTQYEVVNHSAYYGRSTAITELVDIAQQQAT